MKNYILILLLLCSIHFQAKEIYVSTKGNDQNIGSKSSPFATLERAIKELALYAGKEKVTIWLTNGTHYVHKTILLNEAHSGKEGAEVSMQGLGEDVWVKGSLELTALQWSAYDKNIQVASLPEGVYFDQLFINNTRQIRARFPNYDFNNPIRGGLGYQEVTGGSDKRYDTWLGFDPSKFSQKKWKNPQTGIVHAFQSHNWGNMQYHIQSVDYKENKILLAEGGWQLQRSYGIGTSKKKGSPFYVENIFEELDTPGEWFLDEKNSLLYFYPFPELDLKSAVFEVPVIKDIIQFKGTAEKPVHHISIQNLNFSQTTTTFMKEYEPVARGDWAIHRGGAIFMEGAENCHIKACNFEYIGGNGVFMSGYNRKNTVKDSRFVHIGESAVCFVGQPEAVRFYQTWDDRELHGKNWNDQRKEMDLEPGPKSPDYPKDCVVENCDMHDFGDFGKQTAGVFISMSHKIRVNHCSIYNTPRAGICINDGTWGGHIIENCDIWETVRETGEHGPFNSWGRERQWLHGSTNGMIKEYTKLDAIDPVIIRNNRISNFRKSVSAGNWTIDLDDGSSNFEIYNNLSLGSTLKMRDGYFRKAYNNIMVSAVPLGWHVWPEDSEDEFTNNIVVVAGAVAGTNNPVENFIRPAIMPEHTTWGSIHDNNVYWNVNTAEPNITEGISFKEWQMKGYGAHSVIADPLFVDPLHGDFRVKENSPALKLGFKNFAMDQFGHKMTKIGPFGKEFEDHVPVSLTADKRGGSLHYTLDGSEPTIKSPLYTAPIVIVKTTQIKAATFNDQNNRIGYVAEAVFTKVKKINHPSWYQTLIDGQWKGLEKTLTKKALTKKILGATLINIADDPDLIDASGGYHFGCFIQSINKEEGSIWLKAGFTPRMTIQEINGEKIVEIKDLEKALNTYSKQKVTVKVVVGYATKILKIKLP